MKCMNESYFESIFAMFDEKPPFSSILDTFWAIFGQFSQLTSINDPLSFEVNNLLNWISRFFLNWIIFWIESWVKQYWIEYWMNHFLAKFKYWIESNWVSLTPTVCVRKLGNKGVLELRPDRETRSNISIQMIGPHLLFLLVVHGNIKKVLKTGSSFPILNILNHQITK